MNIIKVEQAMKRFQDNVVLNNVNIAFEKGKTYGIIGRNGSGKPSCLRRFADLCRLHPAGYLYAISK